MLDSFLSATDQLLRNFRVADAMDILLIALLLYCALLWFGETASRRMLVGVTLLALVYLFARMFDMHLTSLAFHTGFTVLLILLIVVFQEDLRRMLSRAATWFSLSRTAPRDVSDELETVAEVVFELGKRKVGALVVLPGKEPLERHLSGGVRLDGRISRELLDSIFDPSSDGHDGAIILDEDRITRFGVHLPISTNLRVIRGHGTRHSAAVGLTECSDAVVIVVSEERGVVSLAQGGNLTPVHSSASLLSQLHKAPTVENGHKAAPTWTRHLTKHWRMKVLALSLAMIAWFVLAYDPSTVVRTFDVTIDYRNLPAGLVPERPESQVKLTLSGGETSFRFVTPESMKVSVDLTGRKAGTHAITLGPENVKLPANLEVESIDPLVLWLDLREQAPKPRPSQ